jgi:hypothetical protein
MPTLIPNFETLERRLARLPVVTHRAREVVLTAGSKTGELLFLRSGAVEVVKVSAILARRLDAANRSLIEVKHQLKAGEPPSVIGKAVEKVEELLSYSPRDPTEW